MLTERVREWEGFNEESIRQASRYDDGMGPTCDEPMDGDREALARKLARAVADSRSAIDSASSEVGGGQAIVKVRGSSKLDFPKQLPVATNLNEWKIKVAFAWVQASGYGDKKEVRWFQ